MSDRPCSVGDCCNPAEHAGLLCSDHWEQLPEPGRRNLTETWDAFSKAPSDARWVAYMTACRNVNGYFATARPLAHVSKSAIRQAGAP